MFPCGTHSSRPSCPIPRWTSPTQQPQSQHPGRQRRNSHPFHCWTQPAGSTCCSTGRDFLLPAALTGAEVVLEVSRALGKEGWGSWSPAGTGTHAQRGWGLPVTSDSVHYFWFSKGGKIRDTNLHTPLRRTIKRAEDILERLQILLCPALSTVGCLQNMLPVLLPYAPVLIYSMTLMSDHRAMTLFKQNFQKSEPATPHCPCPLSSWPLCLPHSGVQMQVTPPREVSLPTPSLQSRINGNPTRTGGPHRETCPLFPSFTESTLFLL